MCDQPTSDFVQSRFIEVASVPSISMILGVVPILLGESDEFYPTSLELCILNYERNVEY